LHLFNLDRDIYDQDVEVRFTRYLRASRSSRAWTS
jgi:FAD synthase